MGGFFIQCSPHGEHQWSICLRLCEQEAACLRITIPGPGGQIHRCHASAVGWEWCTPSHHSKCYRLYTQQDSRFWWSVSDFGSSAPDGSIMDAGATQAVSVSSLTNGRASTSQTRSLNAQRSRQDKTLTTLKSTCMVALRDLFVKLIHSQGIADRMGTNLRASLIGCYESHWSRSIEYCLRKRLNVFEVDCQSFSKYLLYLFQVDCYVPSTIISHRTSIASVLQHWKYEPANDPCIRGIFAPKFSVGPTSPMKNDATMELSSHPVSPVMTSLFPWCSL